MGKFSSYVKEGGFALIVSFVLSLILVLTGAMLVKAFALSVEFVSILNVVIKVVSVLVSELLCFRCSENGWVRGGVNGLLFAFASNLLYGVISAEINFDLGFVGDLGLCAVAGILGGIISVNLKRKRFS